MSSGTPESAKLSVIDGVAMLVGIVVGIGIFGFPPMVAANVDTPFEYMAVWVAGGVVMLVGALCYAELGSAYPSAGGEYHYLSRAYGQWLGMLFAWARGTVIQTGAIAAVAFIYGDYANQLVPLGEYGEGLHAAIAVVALSLLNLVGTVQSNRMQLVFTILALAGVLAVIAAALAGASGVVDVAAVATTGTPSPSGSLGMAMVFVLLTYGGWNEAAYLSGEMRDVKRDMRRVLVLGTVVVVALYVAVNLAFLSIFGLQGLRDSTAVAADVMQAVAGPASAILLSLIVCFTALSTINGSIFTGARVYFALGQDIPALQRLSTWSTRGLTPVTALLVQAVITLGLIAFGSLSHGSGVQTMVAYTAPVFWLFMLLVAASVIILRRRDNTQPRPFRVPLYPITPLILCLACAGLVYSSVMYAGIGGLVGLAVLASGVPFMLKYRQTKTRGATARDADIHFSAKTSPEPGKHAVPDTRP